MDITLNSQDMLLKLDHVTSAKIHALVADEAEALEGYEDILSLGILDEPDVKIIRRIMAQESNHVLMLTAMVKKYNGGVSAAVDNAEQAIATIRNGIGTTTS